MPRENSFSDSDGRSLTPDLEDEGNYLPPESPTYATSIHDPPDLYTTQTRESARYAVRAAAATSVPKTRFRYAVRKVIALHRGTKVMSRRGVGAEPGIDPRSASADAEYGGIKQECVIEVADYSAVRSSFGRMTNREFVELMNDPAASARESWVKVRWINIGGMSWDVIKALSIKYGAWSTFTSVCHANHIVSQTCTRSRWRMCSMRTREQDPRRTTTLNTCSSASSVTNWSICAGRRSPYPSVSRHHTPLPRPEAKRPTTDQPLTVLFTVNVPWCRNPLRIALSTLDRSALPPLPKTSGAVCRMPPSMRSRAASG